ncbi:MAG: hypothetical protein ABW098_06435 [Candidatus Thiodiazotropha sp.]
MFNGSDKQPASLGEELRRYCNEFSEFNHRCERLCQALEEIAKHHQSISSFSVRGMGHNAKWLKYRISEFSRRLRALQQRALREER